MYEELAKILKKDKVKFKFNFKLKEILTKGEKITGIKDKNGKSYKCDYLISSMPVKDLTEIFNTKKLTNQIKTIANSLIYRDFVTVIIVLKKINLKNEDGSNLKDSWIYIQDENLKLGRIQVFNNWSPYLLKNKKNFLVGLEFFCNKNDCFWNKNNQELKGIAIKELKKINFIKDKTDLVDYTIARQEKAYPAYFGSYNQFDILKNFFNQFENLFLIGRNGMHRYNNMDHSILSGMTAAQNILDDVKTKTNLWKINTEQSYHESKN